MRWVLVAVRCLLLPWAHYQEAGSKTQSSAPAGIQMLQVVSLCCDTSPFCGLQKDLLIAGVSIRLINYARRSTYCSCADVLISHRLFSSVWWSLQCLPAVPSLAQGTSPSQRLLCCGPGLSA